MESVQSSESTNSSVAAESLRFTTTNSSVSLAVLMGLPASGKSTLANKLRDFSSSLGAVVVSFDDFIPLPVQAKIIEKQSGSQIQGQPENNVAARESSGLAKNLRKKFINCVEFLINFSYDMLEVNLSDSDESLKQKCLENLKASLSSIESNCIVPDEDFVYKMNSIVTEMLKFRMQDEVQGRKMLIIVDDNNYYHSMRNDFYQLAKLSESGFCVIYCKSSLKDCLQRNSTRPLEAQVPSKAIVEMSLKLEEPNSFQNPCDMYCVQIDMINDSENEEVPINLQVLEQIISSTFRNPLKRNEDRTEEIERQRRICSENEIHQADIILRKWVNKKFNLECLTKGMGSKSKTENSFCSNEFKKQLIFGLNSKKKLTLEKLRSGEFKVSYDTTEDVEFREEIIRMFEDMKI